MVRPHLLHPPSYHGTKAEQKADLLQREQRAAAAIACYRRQPAPSPRHMTWSHLTAISDTLGSAGYSSIDNTGNERDLRSFELWCILYHPKVAAVGTGPVLKELQRRYVRVRACPRCAICVRSYVGARHAKMRRSLSLCARYGTVCLWRGRSRGATNLLGRTGARSAVWRAVGRVCGACSSLHARRNLPM